MGRVVVRRDSLLYRCSWASWGRWWSLIVCLKYDQRVSNFLPQDLAAEETQRAFSLAQAHKQLRHVRRTGIRVHTRESAYSREEAFLLRSTSSRRARA